MNDEALRVRQDRVYRDIKDDFTNKLSGWMMLISALAMFGITSVTPKPYRFIPLLASGIAATAAVTLSTSILSQDFNEYSTDNVEREARQDNDYLESLIPTDSDDNAKQLKEAKFKPDLYDWQDLVVTSASSKFKHRLILGTTGGGKTRLLRYLMQLMHSPDEEVTTDFISSAWQKGEFPESNIYGVGGNWSEIVDKVSLIDRDFRERQVMYIEHQYKPVAHYVFDEYRDTVNNVPKFVKAMPNWITQMRKHFQVLWVGIHLANVRTMALEGEGDLRDNFLFIRLGDVAIDFAEQLVKEGKKPEEFAQYVRDMERPCLVGLQPAIIPDVDEAKMDTVKVELNEEEEEVIPTTTTTTAIPDSVVQLSNDEAGKFLYNTMKKLAKKATRSAATKTITSMGTMKYAEVRELFASLEEQYGKLEWNTGEENEQ